MNIVQANAYTVIRTFRAWAYLRGVMGSKRPLK